MVFLPADLNGTRVFYKKNVPPPEGEKFYELLRDPLLDNDPNRPASVPSSYVAYSGGIDHPNGTPVQVDFYRQEPGEQRTFTGEMMNIDVFDDSLNHIATPQ